MTSQSIRPCAGGSGIPFLDAAALREAIGYDAAIAALERAFARSDGARSIERDRHDVDAGELLVMPAAAAEGVGVKLVTIGPGNGARGIPLIHGVFVLFRGDSLEPEALVDGAALTALRTAAVSALATAHLAREDARRLVVFGAGAQAEAHVAAMAAVRPIEAVVVVTRGRERGRALVERLLAAGLSAELGEPDAVAHADVVCTCTTSRVPVFDGASLADGAHVNAIGAYRPDMRELDASVIARSLVFVEERRAAISEGGDLVQAIADGSLDPEGLAGDLAELVRGEVGRRAPTDVTVFKSVGLALEDLVVARAAFEGSAAPR